MKFKLLDITLDERFSNEYQLDDHYKKHVEVEGQYTNITKEEYLAIADNLANQPVDMFRIRGYVVGTEDGKTRYVKWNRDTQDFVVYRRERAGSDPIILSLYKVPLKQFQYRQDKNSAGEIPYGM